MLMTAHMGSNSVKEVLKNSDEIDFYGHRVDDGKPRNPSLQATSETENGNREPFIIGVAGGAASGKNTVCNFIIQQLCDQQVALVNQKLRQQHTANLESKENNHNSAVFHNQTKGSDRDNAGMLLNRTRNKIKLVEEEKLFLPLNLHILGRNQSPMRCSVEKLLKSKNQTRIRWIHLVRLRKGRAQLKLMVCWDIRSLSGERAHLGRK